MAVRNFYAIIDGRKTRLTGGPAAKDGGFRLLITQRDDGDIRRAVYIEGYALPDGRLRVVVDNASQHSDGPAFVVETKR